MLPRNLGFHWRLLTLSVALPATLWLLLHGYHGLTEDAQIYAFQAFSRLHPQLRADLYLQNTSQDEFTLFSPLYACGVQLMGLENAARLLTLGFTICFFAATWRFIRSITDREAACLAILLLLITAGEYGGSGVFRILEPYLTARLPAEALTTAALSCYFGGARRLSLVLAIGSLCIHPLMALPGVLMIICLMLPIRAAAIGMIAGVLATFAIAVVVVNMSTLSHVLVMDAPWLDMVRERSQFLFLQLWSGDDWSINMRPFVSLALTAIVVRNEPISKLCLAATLVGAAGFAVTYIGELVGPISILVQGQGWRWVWIAVFVGTMLVPLTCLNMWQTRGLGPLCALLLTSGWILPGVRGMACVSLAMAIWLMQGHVGSPLSTKIRWISAALGGTLMAWILAKASDSSLSTIPQAWGHVHLSLMQMQNAFALKISAVLLCAMAWWAARITRTPWAPLTVSALLVALSIYILPSAFEQPRTLAAATDIREFVDWENVIPQTSTVLVAPSRDVGAFVWFTLGRPNYLALDQSSGVVFSRATALEIRRRSEVLMPLEDPDWKILTKLRAQSGNRLKKEPATRPLTAQSLVQVCGDPQLGFVIAKEKVAFESLRHEHAGVWKDWNLYDCQKVRTASSPI